MQQQVDKLSFQLSTVNENIGDKIDTMAQHLSEI